MRQLHTRREPTEEPREPRQEKGRNLTLVPLGHMRMRPYQIATIVYIRYVEGINPNNAQYNHMQ